MKIYFSIIIYIMSRRRAKGKFLAAACAYSPAQRKIYFKIRAEPGGARNIEIIPNYRNF
jgi:hypothetical protein